MNKRQIAVEQYLSRAFKINLRIKRKTKMIQELRELAEKTTATISDMPKAPSKSNSRLEDVVVRIVDLEAEIQKDLNELVDTERDILQRIRALGAENGKLQLLLELRYIEGKPWVDVAEILGYGIDNVYHLHRKALNLIEIPETLQ